LWDKLAGHEKSGRADVAGMAECRVTWSENLIGLVAKGLYERFVYSGLWSENHAFPCFALAP